MAFPPILWFQTGAKIIGDILSFEGNQGTVSVADPNTPTSISYLELMAQSGILASENATQSSQIDLSPIEINGEVNGNSGNKSALELTASGVRLYQNDGASQETSYELNENRVYINSIDTNSGANASISLRNDVGLGEIIIQTSQGTFGIESDNFDLDTNNLDADFLAAVNIDAVGLFRFESSTSSIALNAATQLDAYVTGDAGEHYGYLQVAPTAIEIATEDADLDIYASFRASTGDGFANLQLNGALGYNQKFYDADFTELAQGYSNHRIDFDPGDNIIVYATGYGNICIILNTSGATITLEGDTGVTFNGAGTLAINDDEMKVLFSANTGAYKAI